MDPVIAAFDIEKALNDGPTMGQVILKHHKSKGYFTLGDSNRYTIGRIINDCLLKKKQRYLYFSGFVKK